MQHKRLLGSTALVSASLLMSGSALAQEEVRVGGIEVVLGGYTEFGAVAGTKNTVTNANDGGDRKYNFWMDNEVFISANGATETGILYGSHLELEVGSGGLGGTDPQTTVDEVGLYFSGNFGRVELGREDGAEDVMYVGGEDAQAGTGGIDGDIPNINFVQFVDTGDVAKATYFTPRLAGFQLGASFIPDFEDNGGENRFQDTNNEGENGVGGGVNWVGALGALDLTLSAVALWADCESNCTNQTVQGGRSDDELSWAGGALLGFGGFTLGAGYNRNDTFVNNAQSNIINVGLKYGFGAANVSVGWTFNKFDSSDLDDSHLFVVSGDVGILPGVTLKGDVSYNNNDLGACEGGVNDCPSINTAQVADNQDDTWGGVVSVQLDY
jgi:outer membrane protein OmpU